MSNYRSSQRRPSILRAQVLTIPVVTPVELPLALTEAVDSRISGRSARIRSTMVAARRRGWLISPTGQ
ncbi:hypothetical protein AURDEDRAFT_165799 [Auricularia subglabra TFB-10046 SS5]|nr:hypothetical protein AURDEDRAFT_165799 [Auricularia subglabra TFB-10046 SS5]